MSSGPLPFTLLQRVLNRAANRDKRKLPDLSLALSEIDDLMRWQVKDKDNNLIAVVDAESVEWK